MGVEWEKAALLLPCRLLGGWYTWTWWAQQAGAWENTRKLVAGVEDFDKGCNMLAEAPKTSEINWFS